MVDLDELERLEREATTSYQLSGKAIHSAAAKVLRALPDLLAELRTLRANSEADTGLLRDALAEVDTLRARVAEMERDARLGAVGREAVEVAKRDGLVELRRGWRTDAAAAAVYFAIADALRAEEGGEHE